jgi:hypothetical protein
LSSALNFTFQLANALEELMIELIGREQFL